MVFHLQEGSLNHGPLMIRFILLGGPLYIICWCLLWIKCCSIPCSFISFYPSVLQTCPRVFPVGHFIRLHCHASLLLPSEEHPPLASWCTHTYSIPPQVHSMFVSFLQGHLHHRMLSSLSLMLCTSGTHSLCGGLRGSACSTLLWLCWESCEKEEVCSWETRF